MSTPLHFRIAAREDAEAVRALIESAFRAEDSRADWIGSPELATSFTMNIELILATIERPDANILLATDGETILGCIGALWLSDKATARLSWLAVQPGLHRSGIGRRIVEHAEEYCRSTWQVDKLGLNALCTRTALIKWYGRRGFKETGDKTPFPLPDREPGQELHFVEMEKPLV
jgi:ribosomal protein S18 acetylase RimI-like enzyme